MTGKISSSPSPLTLTKLDSQATQECTVQETATIGRAPLPHPFLNPHKHKQTEDLTTSYHSPSHHHQPLRLGAPTTPAGGSISASSCCRRLISSASCDATSSTWERSRHRHASLSCRHENAPDNKTPARECVLLQPKQCVTRNQRHASSMQCRPCLKVPEGHIVLPPPPKPPTARPLAHLDLCVVLCNEGHSSAPQLHQAQLISQGNQVGRLSSSSWRRH
jgi:hypothetical protein